MDLTLESVSLVLLLLFMEDLSGEKASLEDANLNFTELAIKYGQVCEEHDVVTEDGYILKLFHIPGDKTRPVFLISGNMGTADEYIVRGDTSLAIDLAKSNYDVWVGNVRGCKYSKRHVTLDPDIDKEFWNFSFHEYGIYDMAAFVDYVLGRTGQKQVNVIGFSIGTAAFYILGSERPKYNEKVKIMISLAPISYLFNSVSMNAVTTLAPIYNQYLIMTGQEEINGENSAYIRFLRATCSTPVGAYYICMMMGFFPLAGFDEKEIEPDFAPIPFAHYPSSISRKNLLHLAQLVKSKRFPKFDFGAKENIVRYGSSTPPDYKLKAVTMRVALVSGKNDRISTLRDVELLKARLPRTEHIILGPEKFNHLDFVWGRNTYKILHPHIFELLERQKEEVICSSCIKNNL